jgi:DNA-binding transcriptional MerR regulator
MEKAYYSINEVAEQFGVNASTLRYWEKEFTQLKPKRTNGRRYYSTADLELIKQISFLLNDQKLTISGAKARLAINKDSVERKQKLRETLESLKKELSDFRRELNANNQAFNEEIIITKKSSEE